METQHARRARAKALSAQEILDRLAQEQSPRPSESQRFISETKGSPQWRSAVLRVSAVLAATTALVIASQSITFEAQESHGIDGQTSITYVNDQAKHQARAQAPSTKSAHENTSDKTTQTRLPEQKPVAQTNHDVQDVNAFNAQPYQRDLFSLELATNHSATPKRWFWQDTPEPAPAKIASSVVENSFALNAFDITKMTVSKAYIEQLKEHEGLRLNSYLDNGKNSTWTIGYGHTGSMPDGRSIGPRMTITQAQADALLEKDLQEHINNVIDIVGNTPVTQSQFEALVDFSYNKGPENLATSTLLKKLKQGDYLGSADEYLRWTKVVKRDSNGKPLLDKHGKKIAEELPGLVSRAKLQREAMLSSFDPKTLNHIDRMTDHLKALNAKLDHHQSRLPAIKLGSLHRIDRNIQMLDKSANSIDLYTIKAMEKIASINTFTEKLQAQREALEHQYKNEMAALGPHIDTRSDRWIQVNDLANRAHVLDRVMLIHQIDRDRELSSVTYYERQSQALRTAADALKDIAPFLKTELKTYDHFLDARHALTQAQEAIETIAPLALEGASDDNPYDSSAKRVLDERQGLALISMLDNATQSVDQRLDQFEQLRVAQSLAIR